MDASLGKMKKNYVDKGVPVIIGEFGANDRVGVLAGSNYDKHRKGRLEYYQAFMSSCKANQVVPIAWDTGHEGENNMTIIRRQSEPDGSIFDKDVLEIMRKAYGLGDYVNTCITHVENFVEGGTGTIAVRNGGVTSSFGRANLRREGVMLYASGAIKLFDMNGNVLRRGTSELSLQGLRQGVYIAKSGNRQLKVNLR
jgi:hypothetical protein